MIKTWVFCLKFKLIHLAGLLFFPVDCPSPIFFFDLWRMLSKNKIKFLRGLQRKKERKISNFYIVEGLKLVAEILSTGHDWQEIYATESWCRANPLFVDDKRLVLINEKDLAQISSLSSPNEVLMVLKRDAVKDLSFIVSEPLVLALDGISDPGNLGTIIRMADWFGVRHILCSHETVDKYNPKVIQSAMGSIQRVQLYYGNLIEILAKFESHTIIACDLSGTSIYEYHFKKPLVLVVGNESHGISDILSAVVQQNITIPSFSSSSIDSLNVSVATGIVLSTIQGQTKLKNL